MLLIPSEVETMPMLRSDKSRRPTVVISVMAAVFALGAWAAAVAFSVGNFSPIIKGKQPITLHSNPNHEDITRTALSHVVATLSDGSTIQFSDKAQEFIAQMVAETDSLFYDVEEVHFDSETFDKGQARLQEMRQSVGLAAGDGQFATAQKKMSQALHTVEDFYAHSTWVEQNPSRTDLANLGRPGPITTPLGDGIVFVATNNVPTCTYQATQTLFGNPTAIISNTDGTIPLTSEYFSYEQEVLPNSNWQYSQIPPIWKCIHGISTINNNSYDSHQFGYGINKDDVARDLFPQARKLATFAAQQYVDDILGDVRANNSAAAADQQICGLLGFDPVICVSVLTPPSPQIGLGEQQVFTLTFPSIAPPGATYYWTVTGDGSIDAEVSTFNYVTFTAGNTQGSATVSVVVVDASGNKYLPKSVSFVVGATGCFSKVASLANPTSSYSVSLNDYAPDGTISETIQRNGSWKGSVAFSDPPYTSTATESDETTVSYSQPGAATNGTETVQTFASATLDASWVIYGETDSTIPSSGGGSSIIKVVLNPPVPWGKLSQLSAGGPPVNLTYQGVATTAGKSRPFSYTESWQLIGTPTITTQTGLTFATCEFQLISTQSPNTIDTKYKLYGYVFEVKETISDNSSGTPVVQDTQEATAVSINGAPYYGP